MCHLPKLMSILVPVQNPRPKELVGFRARELIRCNTARLSCNATINQSKACAMCTLPLMTKKPADQYGNLDHVGAGMTCLIAARMAQSLFL